MDKTMEMRKNPVLLLLLFLFPAVCFAEVVVLKSGKTVEGKVLERTDAYVKLDLEGVPVTYFMDEVEVIGSQGAPADKAGFTKGRSRAVQAYKSPDGTFQVEFPKGTTGKLDMTTDTPAGPTKGQVIYMREGTKGKILYGLSYNVFPNADLEMKSKAVLDGVVSGTETSDQVIEEEDITVQGHPARRIRYKQHPDWREMEMRAILSGDRLYVLTADRGNKADDIAAFFESFQLLGGKKK